MNNVSLNHNSISWEYETGKYDTDGKDKTVSVSTFSLNQYQKSGLVPLDKSGRTFTYTWSLNGGSNSPFEFSGSGSSITIKPKDKVSVTSGKTDTLKCVVSCDDATSSESTCAISQVVTEASTVSGQIYVNVEFGGGNVRLFTVKYNDTVIVENQNDGEPDSDGLLGSIVGVGSINVNNLKIGDRVEIQVEAVPLHNDQHYDVAIYSIDNDAQNHATKGLTNVSNHTTFIIGDGTTFGGTISEDNWMLSVKIYN